MFQKLVDANREFTATSALVAQEERLSETEAVREDVAAELHDVMANNLFAAAYPLGVLVERLGRESLHEIAVRIDAALVRVRELQRGLIAEDKSAGS